MNSTIAKNLTALAEILKSERQAGKKIVLCHGCFDLLHIGHIRYLRQARAMGDVLVVTVTPDRYVDKGPHRPAFPQALRAEALASLDCVDYVAVNRWPTAEQTLRLLKPHVYVKGSDFKDAAADTTGKLQGEAAIAREIGTEMSFTNDVVFSSSNLINRFFSNFQDEVQQYLHVFRKRYRVAEILALIERMAKLKVLIVGDTILDDYQFCSTLGASSKDPVLSVKYNSGDIFCGGTLAVANHVAQLSHNVCLTTVIGEIDSYETFIRSNLHSNISPHFVTQDRAPTLVKRRFVDGYSMAKLFEVYIMDDSGLSPGKDRILCDRVRQELETCDLVVVSDFGHGAISDNLRRQITESNVFLAVNTQANSGNRGFHSITRYDRADFVSLAEHEIRLETRDIKGPVHPMAERLSSQLNCKNFVVTRGKQGCLVRNAEEGFVEVPAFAQKVVDRIGAGDAFFSATALAAFLEAPAELIGFIGNVVGALAVEIIGNRTSVDKHQLVNFITALLK